MKKTFWILLIFCLTINELAVAVVQGAPVSATLENTLEKRLYGPIKNGQALWNIAKEVRPDKSVSLQQVLIALWRANPQAFSRPCNFNSLKINSSLKLPSLSEIAAIPPAEALAEFRRQIQEWQLALQKNTRWHCPATPVSTTMAKVTPPSSSLPQLDPKPVEDPTSLDWLEFDKEVLQHWQIGSLPEKHAMLKITPKWQETEKLPPQKILGLIPKPSDSYSLASAKLLQVLYDEGVYAVITLINFNKDNELGKAALQLAEQEDMNLIFSMGSESAAFLHEFYNGGKIPVVTCTNKDPVLLHQMADYERGSGTNIAYTSLNVPIDVQIKYLTDLIPELKNLGILYDRNHSQVVATEVMPTQEKLHQMKVTVIDIVVSSKETASDELRKNMAVALALMQKTDAKLEHSVFWVTSSTLVFSNMTTVAQAAGKVPVLGSIPNIVTGKEDSAAMAIGIDRRNNAYLASIYAVKILKGQAKAGELKVGIITPPDIAISFRIAQQIGLKIPFQLFESASFIYDYSGKPVRAFGHDVMRESRN
jgi:putative ABC transport system substrate-binding protein